jgi:hypothetical protein
VFGLAGKARLARPAEDGRQLLLAAVEDTFGADIDHAIARTVYGRDDETKPAAPCRGFQHVLGRTGTTRLVEATLSS